MKVIVAMAGALLMAGCASKSTSLYQWGSYQPALINYTKGGDKAKFEAALRETITKAEAENKVPPGLYAELGYLLYSQGQATDAAVYFAKERDRFPESATLMNKLIAGSETASEPTSGETM